MPARVKKIGNKFRVVEPSGRLVRNTRGTPIDGGGHISQSKASKQAQAVNINQRRRKKK